MPALIVRGEVDLELFAVFTVDGDAALSLKKKKKNACSACGWGKGGGGQDIVCKVSEIERVGADNRVSENRNRVGG